MRLEELRQLVDLSGAPGGHCMQLENCCYGKNEMRALRMARAGLFGELQHGAGAYNHDLRELAVKTPDSSTPSPWRRLWHTRLRGDLYPNHGFAPPHGRQPRDRVVSISSVGAHLGAAGARCRGALPISLIWYEATHRPGRPHRLGELVHGYSAATLMLFPAASATTRSPGVPVLAAIAPACGAGVSLHRIAQEASAEGVTSPTI
ncbi:hypothetical protein SBADM41S_05451 [Streptomyces badius]